MATGCIIGDCPVCDDVMFEDEWIFHGDKMVHTRCKKILLMPKFRMLERIEELEIENRRLKGVIADGMH